MAPRRGPRPLSCLLLLALLLLSRAPGPAAAAPLPLEWRWLARRVPASGARPALRGFFEGLRGAICALPPANFSQLPMEFMDQVSPCARPPRPALALLGSGSARTPPAPLRRAPASRALARRSASSRWWYTPTPHDTPASIATPPPFRPGTPPQLCPLEGASDLRRFDRSSLLDISAFREAAARPAALGGALILLAADGDAGGALTLQRSLCAALLDPKPTCGWPPGAPAANPYRDYLLAGGRRSNRSSTGVRLLGSISPIAAKAPPPKAWLSMGDPFEGLSEGAVQSAVWW
jgi:hypothetical protein